MRKETAWLDLAPMARADGVVALPGSKSISNRTLLLAALSAGDTRLAGLLDADDVDRMKDALAALGIEVDGVAGTRDFVVHGHGGEIPVKAARLHLGNAGTALRPLTAVLALAGGRYELSGVTRMHERPIGDLVDALRYLGADIRYLGNPGYPPLAIEPGHVHAAGARDRVTIRGDVSSQFTSALLMALPTVTAHGGRALAVDIAGELISKPYVAITTHLMERFGVAVERDEWRSFRVPAGARYASPGSLYVEGDASSASYFLAAGAIGGGPVRVTGVGRHSIQGDVAFADALARMGAQIDGGDDWIEARSGRMLNGIAIDCTAIPDAAMTLAVVALFARGPTTTDRHCELASERDGPHRSDGDGAPQARRGRRHRRRSPHCVPAAEAPASDHRHLRRPSDRHVLFPRGAGRRAGAHPRPRLRAQDVSPLLRGVREGRQARGILSHD